MKKAFSLFLAIILVFTVIPSTLVTALDTGLISGEEYQCGDFFYRYDAQNDRVALCGTTETISGDVIVPETLDGYTITALGAGAFENLPNITSITIPNTITYISSNCVYGCAKLKTIYVPASVTQIGENAFFSSCTSLENIFVDSQNQHYTSVDGILYNKDKTVLMTCPNAKKFESFTVPYGVTTIADSAFEFHEELTTLIMPQTVTKVERFAFFSCINLSNVTFSKNLSVIEMSAFGSCDLSGLLTLPDSLTYLEFSAFGSNYGLTEVYIPKNLYYIGSGAFSSCYYMNKYSVSSENKHFTSLDGVLYNKNLTEIVSVPIGKDVENYVMPDTVTKIGDEAFDSTDVSNITFSKNLTEIGQAAFAYCQRLESITIPNTVKKIGGSAFTGCYSLKNISFPDSVEEMGAEVVYNTAYYSDSANWQNGALYVNNHLVCVDGSLISGEFAVKENTKTISNQALYMVNGLTQVTMPDSVVGIGEHAFGSCENLKEIKLSKNIKIIGSSAFDGCDSLISITLPGSLTAIKDHTFANCDALETVVIENGPTYIGEAAFDLCANLKAINIPPSVQHIEKYAFLECSSLGNIQFNEGLQSIGYGAFFMSGLSGDIVVPNSVTVLDYGCFSFTPIKSLIVGNGVTEISTAMCQMCFDLETVVLGSSVTTIGESAFVLTGLKSITLPSRLTEIKRGAFVATDLTDVYYKGTQNTKNQITIDPDGNEILDEVTWHLSEYVLGDINASDAEPDLDDVVALAQIVADWQGVAHNPQTLDVNGDGSVNIDDVVLLAQYVAGWGVGLK